MRSHHARIRTLPIAAGALALAPLPQAGRMNFALGSNGSVATASSTYTECCAFSPAAAIDGEHKGLNWLNGGGWHGGTNTFPQWLQVDFNASRTIDEIDVYTMQDDYANPIEPTESTTFALYGLTGYQAQYWNGSGWVDVPGGNISGNNKVWRKISFAALTTTKIRLLTSASVDGWSRLPEIEAWGPATSLRTNVALAANGSVATASSVYPPVSGFDGSVLMAINGDRKGLVNGSPAWWNDNTQNVWSDWLQIEFSGFKTIDEIDLFTTQDAYTSPSEPTETMTLNLYGLTSFELQYWNGSAWAAVPGGNITGNNKIWQKFTFAPLTTTKIRVVTNSSPDGWSRITELEAWGAAPGGSSAADFAMARLDPHNRTGAGGVDLLSNNVNWSLPLIGLPGRGLDLGLSLSYNSLVWTRAGNAVAFDLDEGSIAPGFRLGFPIIEGPYFSSQANLNFYLLVTPSGARVELRQTSSGSAVYESKDSSYLQFTDNLNGTATLRPTDGSQMNYIPSAGGWRCSKITDRNGNYLSVTYKSFGEIDQVTDTLGRVLTFNYDNNWNIQSIEQSWTNQPHHLWATFGWGTATIGNNLFPGLNNLGPSNTSIPVLTSVGLPDGSSYDFYYNTYGQLGSLARSASDALHHSYTVYDYNSPGDDCPRVSQTRVWATNWSDQQGVPHEVATSFGHDTDGGCRMTMPDGTVYKEYYGYGYQAGLTTETRNYASIADANSNLWQKRTTTAWTQENLNVSYLTNPRATQSDIEDRDGNHRRTTIDYGDPNLGYVQWSLPYVVKEYGVVGTTATELRHTQTDYNLTQPYLNQRIIGLVSRTKLYDPIAGQWQAKTTYSYDTTAIDSQATTATHHEAAYDQNYNSSSHKRGNVTTVSRWDVTDIDNSSKVLVSTVTYNAAGSVTSSTDPAGHTNGINYADSFSDNQNHNTFAYPTTITDADGFSSTVQYRFEFGAKTQVQTPLPNVTTNQAGPVTIFAYDSAGRVERVTANNGAYTKYSYDADYVSTLSTVNNLTDEAFTFQLLNGNGQVFISGGNHPGSSGGYRAQTTYYDQMGRVMKQSNPTEINDSWIPAGDDVYNAQADTGGWRFTEQTYDWKGRTNQTTHPDGAYTSASYTGCGCAGGEVVTLTDEMSRRQKVYSDVLGRAWKTEVLNWNGTVYSTTTSNLNALDQATLVRQYAGTDQSTSYQDTTMSYDGFGRLKTKHVPEQDTGTNTTWEYNADDTLHMVTDARGASATYGYNNRKLVTGITYVAPQCSNIPATPNSTFEYDAAGNRISMSDANSGVTYHYDQVSRMDWEERTFAGLSSNFRLTYSYNFAGDLASVTDPWGTQTTYSRDSSGRLMSVTGSGPGSAATYVSSVQYRASEAVKGVNYGNATQLAVSYSNRMQAMAYNLTSQNSQNATVMNMDYTYSADGMLRNSTDHQDATLDRAYSFDHASRLADAFTGSEARNWQQTNGQSIGTVVDGPYRQSYTMDVWNNITTKWGRSFTGTHLRQQTVTHNYDAATNRISGWYYDANGSVLAGDGVYNTYDAAGRTHETTNDNSLLGSFTYDGDGELLKRFNGETIYYLRSTTLGAKVAEIAADGSRTNGFVYADGELIATLTAGSVFWQHRDASDRSLRTTGLTGELIGKDEVDPSDVSVDDPGQPAHYHGGSGGGTLSAGGGESRPASLMNTGFCSWSGMLVPCAMIASFQQHLNSLDQAGRDHWNGITTWNITVTANFKNGTVATWRSRPIRAGLFAFKSRSFEDKELTLNDFLYGQNALRIAMGLPIEVPQSGPPSLKSPQNPGLTQQQTSARNHLGECSVRAMLDTLSYSEHAGYDTVVMGTVLRAPGHPELVGQTNVKVPDFSQHPNILVQAGRWQSTAAGRYQFLNRTWTGLDLPNFEPWNQDIGGVMLMQRRGMITSLLSGDVETAITNGNAEWASLPGSPYGQGTRSMNSLKKVYDQSFLRCVFAMHEIHQGLRDNNGV